jgi:hypothetical protein
MSNTVVYKGWVSISPPRRGRDETIILSPGRFFYRPNKHVIAEKIADDIYKHGPYINMTMWSSYCKIQPHKDYLSHSFMGLTSAEYNEISDANYYRHTYSFINMGNLDFLAELAKYRHHYCIIEITYHKTEFDMISHEMELILLLNHNPQVQ